MVTLMEWPWVTTEFPRYISVTGSAVHKEIIGTNVLDFEMCDLLIRRLSQLDTNMEPNSSRMCWRHLLESDFSFAVPAFIDQYWSAYMFDMKEEIIHVLDPLRMHEDSAAIKELHTQSANLIQGKLFDCFNKYYENWNPQKKEWPHVYPLLTNNKFEKNQSGLCMLHCIRNYNGDELDKPLTLKCYSRLQHTMLSEILNMEKNKSRLPIHIVKIIGKPK